MSSDLENYAGSPLAKAEECGSLELPVKNNSLLVSVNLKQKLAIFAPRMYMTRFWRLHFSQPSMGTQCLITPLGLNLLRVNSFRGFFCSYTIIREWHLFYRMNCFLSINSRILNQLISLLSLIPAAADVTVRKTIFFFSGR